jgi:hypothetical protein
MKISIDLKLFTLSLIAFFCSYSIVTGYAQKFIHFSGELNEMATFVLAGVMGTLCLFASIERIKK